MKAVLWSALVFPGTGHLFLQRYLRGAGLMVLTSVGLAVIVVEAVHKALTIAAKLQRGEVTLDVQTISELLSQSTAGAGGLVLDIATYVVLLCWLVGIFDAYRIGKGEALAAGREETGGQGTP